MLWERPSAGEHEINGRGKSKSEPTNPNILCTGPHHALALPQPRAPLPICAQHHQFPRRKKILLWTFFFNQRWVDWIGSDYPISTAVSRREEAHPVQPFRSSWSNPVSVREAA
jgi:hypothetical protein